MLIAGHGYKLVWSFRPFKVRNTSSVWPWWAWSIVKLQQLISLHGPSKTMWGLVNFFFNQIVWEWAL